MFDQNNANFPTEYIPNADILLVDDAPVNLHLLTRMLSQQGFSLRSTSNGVLALKAVEEKMPDLILLDIQMPEMDGFEVCRRLKADMRTYHIPIIFISALEATEEKVNAFDVGGVDYISKPFQVQEVLARVETHLKLYYFQKRLQEANAILEKKVAERTNELEYINQSLQSQITERMQAEQALRESEERYALAVQGSNDGIWDWDLRNEQIYFSPRWKAILGYEDQEIKHRIDEWFIRVDPYDLTRLRTSILNHVEGDSPFLVEEYRMLHKDRTYRHVLTRGLAIRDDSGKAHRIVGSQTDITYRKRIEEQLQQDAFYDNLTALPNRVLFLDRLSSSIKLAQEHQDYDYSVVIMDIDQFKRVNEVYGHQIADLLLVEISFMVKQLIRPVDTAARIGEDEFGVLLENVSSVENVNCFIGQIQEQLAAPVDIEGCEIAVSLSFGVVLGVNATRLRFSPYTQADEVLRDAETAIQQAKKMNERTKSVIFGNGNRNTEVVNLELESELHHAIENQDEIEVYYQPVVMLETGRISGFEALVRWNHPQRGLIFPDHFIPLAEAKEMIVSLDRLVIQKVFKQTSLWQKKHHTFPPISISINLSGSAVKEPDLVDYILKTKDETGMDLRGLSLEISETLLNDIPEDVSRSLAQLRKYGMHILADDFGKGYSSLNSLHLLPVDGIKIERSIIEGAIEKKSYEKMLQTIFLLAHELGLNAVVKGIETTEMLALLRGWECRYGQGFLFTKAVSYNEAEKLLEDDIKTNGLYHWSDIS